MCVDLYFHKMMELDQIDSPEDRVRILLVCFRGLMSHLRLYCGLAKCAATLESHAADTGHDIPPNIHTWGQPVIVLSIDVERHTGIHN